MSSPPPSLLGQPDPLSPLHSPPFRSGAPLWCRSTSSWGSPQRMHRAGSPQGVSGLSAAQGKEPEGGRMQPCRLTLLWVQSWVQAAGLTFRHGHAANRDSAGWERTLVCWCPSSLPPPWRPLPPCLAPASLPLPSPLWLLLCPLPLTQTCAASTSWATCRSPTGPRTSSSQVGYTQTGGAGEAFLPLPTAARSRPDRSGGA